MFKLVVVFAFFAVVAAKPGVLLSSPLTSVISPVVTTYSSQAGGIWHPSPIVYTSPWTSAHYIKKRSAPISYIVPNTYLTNSPLTATTYAASLYHTAPAYTLPLTTTHFIKKRSAPLLSTTYITPSASILPTTYTATAPVISTPYLTSNSLISHPLTHFTHFIKKRSASAQTAYITPASFSHQSRIDLSGYPLVSTYSSPLIYSTPTASISHVI